MLRKSQEVGSVMGIGLSARQRPRGARGGSSFVQPIPCQAPSRGRAAAGSARATSRSLSKWFARKYLGTLESIRKTEQVRELPGVPGEHQKLGHLGHPAANAAQAPFLRKYPSCGCCVRRGQKSRFSLPGGCGLAQGKTSSSVK